MCKRANVQPSVTTRREAEKQEAELTISEVSVRHAQLSQVWKAGLFR